MTMINKFFIAITLLACFPVSAGAGLLPQVFTYKPNVPMEHYSEPAGFARNELQKPSEGASIDDAEKSQKDKPRTLTPKKNVPKKTKQIKPFVPSETIPADQAVDFPYDI